MAHVPEWERLADALKRVIATGMAEREAQVAICGAISRRKIRVQLFIGHFERASFFLQEGWEREVPPTRTPRDFALWESALTGLPPRERSLTIPSDIVPEDFDWQQSRPLKPWRDTKSSFSFLDWHGDRLELCSSDVTRVLIASTIVQQSLTSAPKNRPTGERAQPERERAKKALDEIYGNAIPDQNTVRNKVLHAKVNQWLKARGLSEVKLDMVLRASGRRKD